MSIFRTYFDKNNTIISGNRSAVNTGRNPVTEIFYGTDISRFLFYIDFSDITAMITEKLIDVSTITRHTLKMKNTSNFDVLPYRDYRDQIQFSDKNHATSCDLELIPIYEDWDEGTGYEFTDVSTCLDESDYVNGYSNWTGRTQQYAWTTAGAVTGTTAIATQHFDKGNEDIEIDITDFVNGILTGDTAYSGFCLKFTSYFEAYEDGRMIPQPTAIAFFTRHTNTFFEPFIETEYNDLVKDDRQNFILDQTGYLVLYVSRNGNLFNLDELPVCTINSTTFPVTQKTKGIYSAEVLLPSSTYDDLVMYHDVWSNIIINGIEQENVSLDVTPLPKTNKYQIGNTAYEPLKYGISLSGIKRDENIKQGERKRITVNIRKPYTVSERDVIDDVYYRVYVKQGVNQITVIDWTEVNRTFDSNYFVIDTSWFVPQQYFIDIKVKSNDETNIYNEEIKFNVINLT